MKNTGWLICPSHIHSHQKRHSSLGSYVMPFNNFVKIDFFDVLASLGSVLNDFRGSTSGVNFWCSVMKCCISEHKHGYNFSEFSIEIYILARIMGKIYFLKGQVSSLDLYYFNFTKIEIEWKHTRHSLKSPYIPQNRHTLTKLSGDTGDVANGSAVIRLMNWNSSNISNRCSGGTRW